MHDAVLAGSGASRRDPEGNLWLDLPKLADVTSLAEMIRKLDQAAAGLPGSYAEPWFAFLQELGSSAHVTIDSAGARSVTIGYPMDPSHEERSARINKIVDHCSRSADARDQVFTYLESRFLVCDNRARQLREMIAAARNFLAYGGRLMMNPSGHLETNLPWESMYPDVGDGSAARAAGTQLLRLQCRHSNLHVLLRVVRALGERLDNGWVLLKAKAPVKRRRKVLSLRHGAAA